MDVSSSYSQGMGKKFVVAAWDGPMQVRMEPDEVEADTAEHAVEQVMAENPQHLPETVYEAWPEGRPSHAVKFTV
jgi:hypothetical protein